MHIPWGQDIPHVVYVNCFPQIYTVFAPNEEYALCNCLWVDQGNICKHVVHVYKMIHLEVQDTGLIRKKDSQHMTLTRGNNKSLLEAFQTTDKD